MRYSESSLGSMAGAEFQFYQPGEVIPTINEGYGFDDVDGQEVPGQNESDNFPIETATATTVVSGTYSGGQIAVKIIKQAEFDYFMGLVLPHAVTFTINVTYSTPAGNVTQDVDFSGTLISAVETNDGAVVNPVRWYTFTMGVLIDPPDVPATATINTTKFILNDNEALVVGPFFSPVESAQLWLHTQVQLGGKKSADWKVTIWKIDDDYNQVPGTQQTFTYHQGTPHKSSSEVFYRTDKLTPTGGFGKYAINFQRTDNSSDASILKVEEIHSVNVRTNVVHPTTNNKTHINYRVLNGAIVEQEAENPNKIEIVGFRNEYQARERALRETKRLIYSRVKMNAKVFEDGIMQVGSVVQIADIYDSNQQQGYITGRAGNSFDTSEPIAFTGSMYVLVTDSIGSPTLRYPAAARADTKYGFTAAIPDIQLNIWNGDTVQLPSRYLIATVEELNSQLWTVNSIKPNTDNTVSLTVAEYSDAIYQ
ncbi:hypothetical protein E5AUHO_37120 [Citrobacter freundii]|nr:hypothetical protein E5AUHO_37120 [Citrobacter freundii]